MTTTRSAEREPAQGLVDVSTWADAASREILDLVASSVAELVGFEIAVINVVNGDHLVAVAVEGTPEMRSALSGVRSPLSMLNRELERAETWGRFRFVPHDRLPPGDEVWGWVPDIDVLDAADAWHPVDLLTAPLFGPDGNLIGQLSIDIPLDGLRPGTAQRHVLDRFAAQAERALRLAIDRDTLAHRVRLTDTMRQVIGYVTAQTDLDAVLTQARQPLAEGFGADLVSVRAYAVDDFGDAGTPSAGLPLDVVAAVRATARRAWTRDEVVVLGAGSVLRGPRIADDTDDLLRQALADAGLASAVLAPLGTGATCVGHIILGRVDAVPTWTAEELHAAREVARDIGHAVARAREQAREQQLLARLQELSSYKSELLATVSHELKNPLTAVAGHVEMLQTMALPSGADRSVAALERAAQRMSRLVGDLLELSEVEDPRTKRPHGSVLVAPLLADAADLVRVAARRKGLEVVVDVPEEPLLLCGDPDDLDRVLGNLVGNAVKYTPRGGRVVISARRHATEAEVTVIDDGIGLSETDRTSLFTEFFRSDNPAAREQPGTGLGLVITRRIVQRHGGRIEVESELGVGSTFRTFWPVPDDEVAGD